MEALCSSTVAQSRIRIILFCCVSSTLLCLLTQCALCCVWFYIIIISPCLPCTDLSAPNKNFQAKSWCKFRNTQYRQITMQKVCNYQTACYDYVETFCSWLMLVLQYQWHSVFSFLTVRMKFTPCFASAWGWCHTRLVAQLALTTWHGCRTG